MKRILQPKADLR